MFTNQTAVADIVREHYQAAQVLEKYGVDFCCKGNRPLDEACREKRIDTNEVLKEIEQSVQYLGNETDRYENWSLEVLTDYIIQRHHYFIRKKSELLLQEVAKVSIQHGDVYPETIEIAEYLWMLIDELQEHMTEEETIVFPLVRQIAHGKKIETDLEAMIYKLEGDHYEVDHWLEKIRELSNNFTPPERACTTHRELYAELRALEKDLHIHVHLENNILFPKAIEMSKVLKTGV
ncbi:MAG: iron-sulfur cluster repair di-iron protein [Bacteroidota bacterium]